MDKHEEEEIKQKMRKVHKTIWQSLFIFGELINLYRYNLIFDKNNYYLHNRGHNLWESIAGITVSERAKISLKQVKTTWLRLGQVVWKD